MMDKVDPAAARMVPQKLTTNVLQSKSINLLIKPKQSPPISKSYELAPTSASIHLTCNNLVDYRLL